MIVQKCKTTKTSLYKPCSSGENSMNSELCEWRDNIQEKEYTIAYIIEIVPEITGKKRYKKIRKENKIQVKDRE